MCLLINNVDELDELYSLVMVFMYYYEQLWLMFFASAFGVFSDVDKGYSERQQPIYLPSPLMSVWIFQPGL